MIRGLSFRIKNGLCPICGNTLRDSITITIGNYSTRPPVMTDKV